jgi:lipoate-protein ligase A
MAVDEVLLEDAESGVATFRCYGWSEPTLSLGYFQRAADRADHAASLPCPLVRRASGGGAILHATELTYSFAVLVADRLGGDAASLYQTIHGAIVETLTRFGVVANAFPGPDEEAASSFLCFQRRIAGDLVVGRSKIVGSAQRRHRGAILQHGSVLLGASRFAPELPGIAELTGRSLNARELADELRSILSRRLTLRWTQRPEPDSLGRRADVIARAKFAAADWTLRR